MKTDEVIVKQSNVHGKGVFAKRDFKAGDIVLRWDKSNVLTVEEFKKLTDDEKRYVCFEDGIYVQMQEPERYVNHSCDSNTTAKQFSDIATRDIKEGEEITSNYNGESPTSVKFKCDCGSLKCSDAGKC
jgi:SET domain-containing protein